MKQKTLAMAADPGAGFDQYRRATRRDVFLSTMNEIVPWQALCEVIDGTRCSSSAARWRTTSWANRRARSLRRGWPSAHDRRVSARQHIAWRNMQATQ